MIGFGLAPVAESDFDELLALRIATMRAIYIATPFQGRGPGSAVLQRLSSDTPESVQVLRVGALRDSDANRFYQRHGFVRVCADEWDIAYECRRHATAPLPS